MNPLKRAIVRDIVKQTGAHDEPHIFGGPPGDPGLIGPGSMSWEINGDIASVVVGGLGAIVMEILHPSVMAGVQDLSNYQEQPERRGKTTFGYVVTTTFGNTQAATRLINAVKRMHSQVERHAPRRRPLPRARPGADRLGPHLHPVGGHDRVRALQPAADRGGEGPLPARAGA